MRIVHVHDIAHVASTLAAAQRSLGHEAEVIEPSRAGFGTNRRLRLALAPWRYASLAGVVWRLARGEWDVVHAHYGWRAIVVLPSRRRFVLHFHGTDCRGIARRSFRGRLNAALAHRAARVYFATPDLAETVRGYRRDAVFLPNPIEVEVFERPVGAETAPDHPRRDLLIGVRLDPIKGLDVILEAIREVVARRPETTITVVDQGVGAPDAIAAAGPSVEVVGRLRREELPGLLHRHRLALGQFRVGAIGNYELECLAAGRPVVMRFDYDDAYDSPPPLVKAASGSEAAAEVLALLDDPARCEEIGRRGHEWVLREHDAMAVAARVLADYEALGFDRGR